MKLFWIFEKPNCCKNSELFPTQRGYNWADERKITADQGRDKNILRIFTTSKNECILHSTDLSYLFIIIDVGDVIGTIHHTADCTCDVIRLSIFGTQNVKSGKWWPCDFFKRNLDFLSLSRYIHLWYPHWDKRIWRSGNTSCYSWEHYQL